MYDIAFTGGTCSVDYGKKTMRMCMKIAVMQWSNVYLVLPYSPEQAPSLCKIYMHSICMNARDIPYSPGKRPLKKLVSTLCVY